MAPRATTFLTLDQLKTWCKVTPGQARAVTSLVAAGTLATATVTNHGFRHRDTVAIAGALPTTFNGSFAVDVLDANTITFALTQVPASSPATGTIYARSDQDAVLTIIADRVCAALERDTDRIFTKREGIEERLNGTGLSTLRLKYFPIVALQVLTIDGVTLVEGTDFVVESARGVVRFINRVCTKGVGNVRATYDAGYEPDELPSDVIGTSLDIAKYYWDRHMSQGLATTSLTIGGSTVSIVSDLPRDLRNDLKALMNPRVIG